MGEYNVNLKPLIQMSDNEIRDEARELRTHITVIECELSKRRAWGQAEEKDTGKNHLIWLANTRSLRSKLVSRYAALRPREKDINRKMHRGTKHDSPH